MLVLVDGDVACQWNGESDRVAETRDGNSVRGLSGRRLYDATRCYCSTSVVGIVSDKGRKGSVGSVRPCTEYGVGAHVRQDKRTSGLGGGEKRYAN